MTTELAAVYRRAMEVIKTNGWCQGNFFESGQGVRPADCPVCAAGALGVAVAGDPFVIDNRPLLLDAERFLSEHVGPCPADLDADPDPVDVIATWNDDPFRTVDHVLAVLERAAVAAESGGAA